MKARLGAALCVAWLLPAAAGAQQLNGLAAWTVANGSNTYDGKSFQNNSFSQHYILGVDTPILDPRFLRLNTEGSFRTNGLTSGASESLLKGKQHGVGYKVGASLFPRRPFPLTFGLSRELVDESGDYPTSNAIRGGFAIPAGTLPPAFQTVNHNLSANWQLTDQRLPQVELSYAKGDVATVGDVFRASERHADVHAGVRKETARLRNAFRYDRSAQTNYVSSAYDQRNQDLDYEFGALLTERSRFNVHAGRRRTYSLFDRPLSIVDSGTGAYVLPSTGDMQTRYVISSVSFQPATKLTMDATGSIDRALGTGSSSGAKLVAGTARLDVGFGLTVNAAANFGTRDQVVGDRAVSVVTQNGQVGSSFRTGPQWLEMSAAFNKGKGMNRTPDGFTGGTHLWSGGVSLNSTFSLFSLSVGEDRANSKDEILDLGNSDILHDRASVTANRGRVALSATWEEATTDRGRDISLTRQWQRTSSGAAAFRAGLVTLSANAGDFVSIGLSGTDSTQFVGGSFDAEPLKRFHLAGFLRKEDTTATQTGLVQKGYSWNGTGEYRLRDFTLGFEVRNINQDLRVTALTDPYQLRGRQFQMRISRKISIPLI